MSDTLREKLEKLVEEIWRAYERALAVDESDDGCEHTPDGDPLVCWNCRKRAFELVAMPRLAAILADMISARGPMRKPEGEE